MDLGVKNQLFSYYYLRHGLSSNGHKTLALLARMKRAAEKGYFFILDSGAFTFQTKAKKTHVPPPRLYFEEYKDFIIKYHHLFRIIAELDIDTAVKVDSAGNVVTEGEDGRWLTTQEIDEWTEELLSIPVAGPKIMPVYHADRGDNWLRDWLLDTRSPYVGSASDLTEGTGAFISQAHRAGKWVHGFGQTRIKTDAKYHAFDSVDSSTWLRADRFGGTMIFRNGKLIVLDHLHKGDRRLYRDWYEGHGLDFKLIIKDDLQMNRMATIITWRDMSTWFERQASIRNQGRRPYLWELHENANVPAEHPLITRARAQ